MLYINIGQVGGVLADISEAKSEAAQRINKSRLSVLEITPSDLASGRASFEGRSEILYSGHLYDIASQTRRGDNIVLKVLRDEKEEGLLSSIKEIVDGWISNPQRSNKQPSLKQLVIIKDFIPACKFSLKYNATLMALSSAGYSYPTESPLMIVLKSPPKFV
jgi:hypothetical protein